MTLLIAAEQICAASNAFINVCDDIVVADADDEDASNALVSKTKHVRAFAGTEMVAEKEVGEVTTDKTAGGSEGAKTVSKSLHRCGGGGASINKTKMIRKKRQRWATDRRRHAGGKRNRCDEHFTERGQWIAGGGSSGDV